MADEFASDVYGPGGTYGPGYSPMDPFNVSNDTARPNAFADASPNPAERAVGRDLGCDIADSGSTVYDQNRQRGNIPDAQVISGPSGGGYNRFMCGNKANPPADNQQLYYNFGTDGKVHAFKDKSCKEEVANPEREDTMLDKLARENPEALKALYEKLMKLNPGIAEEYDATKNYSDLRAKEGTYLTPEEEVLAKSEIEKTTQDLLKQETAKKIREVMSKKEKSEMTSEQAEKESYSALMKLARTYSKDNSK